MAKLSKIDLNLSKNLKESEGEEMTSNWDETVETFDELDLKKDLLRGSCLLKARYLWIRL